MTTNETLQFAGAVHESAGADIGTNRDGERVVRLDLFYTRGTAPSQTTTILTLDAAITLRNELDGLFAAAGIDDGADDDDEGLRGADSYDLLRFARAYASLGDAIGEQVEDLLAGRYDEVTAGAMSYIRERLGGINRELDDAIESYDERADDESE